MSVRRDEAEDLRLLHGPLVLARAHHPPQVAERPGGGGDGQAVVNGGIEGGGSVDPQAAAGSPSRLASSRGRRGLVSAKPQIAAALW